MRPSWKTGSPEWNLHASSLVFSWSLKSFPQPFRVQRTIVERGVGEMNSGWRGSKDGTRESWRRKEEDKERHFLVDFDEADEAVAMRRLQAKRNTPTPRCEPAQGLTNTCAREAAISTGRSANEQRRTL